MKQIPQVKIAQLFAAASQEWAEGAPNPEALQLFNERLEAARQVVWSNGSAPREPEAPRPKVWIGMPYLNAIQPQTLETVLTQFCGDRPDGQANFDVTFRKHPSSLLADSFNQVLCECLNYHLRSDWFLLHHADISHRTPKFLDPLIAEAERGEWDILHVPMPIKDTRALTSTAVSERGKPWSHRRRLTVHELLKLPDDRGFGLEEVLAVMREQGAPVPDDPILLPNTGVLLFRVADWLWKFPGFEIRNRIEDRCESGRTIRVPSVLPEDWNLGWWAAEEGLKVGCFRGLRCDHWMLGTDVRFPNDAEFGGEDQDQHYLGVMKGKVPLTATKQEGSAA